MKPFDTWASMPHLLAAEDWPGSERQARTIAYFCSVVDGARFGSAPDADGRQRRIPPAQRSPSSTTTLRTLSPPRPKTRGFRWSLLCDPRRTRTTSGRQATRQPVLAGERRPYRPLVAIPSGAPTSPACQPGRTGFSNLTVAGDSTNERLEQPDVSRCDPPLRPVGRRSSPGGGWNYGMSQFS